MNLELVCHPGTPARGVFAVSAYVSRGATDLLVNWEVRGDNTNVSGGEGAGPGRQDELWQSTCFEAFVRPIGRDLYVELNVSPTGAWASYLFDAYRENMRAASAQVANDRPFILVDERIYEALANFDLRADFGAHVSESWALNIAVVIEEYDGIKSYWALAHPTVKPDFHDPDCFVLNLPPPTAP